MKPPKISELLEKINRVAADADFAKMSKIELDVLMQHLRDLYSELDVLRNGNVLGVATNNNNVQTEVVVSKRVLNPNEGVLMQDPVVKKDVVGDNSSNGKKELADDTTSNGFIQKEAASKSSINESTKSASSLNEKLKTEAKEVHKKLSTKPLKDLIDLNKKFVLQNELFSGNSSAFVSAVQEIDTATDYATAEKFIQQLQAENNWDATSQTVRMFGKLVKQKFGVE